LHVEPARHFADGASAAHLDAHGSLHVEGRVQACRNYVLPCQRWRCTTEQARASGAILGTRTHRSRQ
jgi:hypothetical protein